MNYAIIGCGKFGKIHLKTLLEMDKNVKYVCNKTDSKFKEIQDEYCINGKGKDIQFITDYSIVLNDPDINIVCVTTGPLEHYQLVKAAILAKKNVICEKPFVFTETEVNELYDLSIENKVILLVNYSDTFSPTLIHNNVFSVIRDIIKNNDSCHIFYQNFNCGPDRGNSYSTLWDYGVHVAAFAYAAGITKLETTQIFSFDSILKGYISKFTAHNNINCTLNAQYGNCFSNKMKGITFTIPSKYLNKDKTGVSTYILDLRNEKTLNQLYLITEHYLNDKTPYNENFDFYRTISLFATWVCSDIEKQMNL